MRRNVRRTFLLVLLLTLYPSNSTVVPVRQRRNESSKLPIATTSMAQTVTPKKLTVTFSGFFNFTTTVTLDNSTKETLLFPNGTLKSSLPWSLSSGFNFSASHGPVRASFGGGVGGGGNGGGGAGGGGAGTKETGGAGAGGGGIGGSGAGLGMGGVVEINGRPIAGFGAANSYAVDGGGGAGTGGLGGGCATGGSSSGGKSGVGRACTGAKAMSRLSLGDRRAGMADTVKEVLEKNSTGYGRADGFGTGASAGTAAGNGTKSFANAFGEGTTKNGSTLGAAFGMGNGGGSGSSSGGSVGGNGLTRSESDEDAGIHGLGVGLGRAMGTGTGGGSGVAASGGSKSSAGSIAEQLEDVLKVGESEDGRDMKLGDSNRNSLQKGTAAMRISRGEHLREEVRMMH